MVVMNSRLSRANIPISEVVVAFQPRQLGVSWFGMEAGRVALFRLGDTRVHLFDCHDGACWDGWRANPNLQLEWLLELKEQLIEECKVSSMHAHGAFLRCWEYWQHHVASRKS